MWPGCCSENPTLQQSLVSKDASLQCCTSTAGNMKTSFAFFSCCCCCNPAKQRDYKDFGWWDAFSCRINLPSGRQQKATAVSRLEEDKEENKRWLLPKRLAQMLQWLGVVSEIDGIFMFNEEQEGHGRKALLAVSRRGRGSDFPAWLSQHFQLMFSPKG